MESHKKGLRRINTVQFITLMFLIIIFIGSFLLFLPISHQTGKQLTYIDALFVATSSVCVTGLTPINISQVLSPFGHIVMMILIEIGGLGFMSIALIVAMMFRKRVSLQSRLVIKEMLNLNNHGGVVKLLKFVVKFSVSVQLLGVILLGFQFIPEYGVKRGIFYSIFHAVSAFCNAGFDLFGDSLLGYQQNPYVLLVISGLIISGGFGFIVWYDLIHWQDHRRFSLHTKIALMVTLSLLIGGTVLFSITDRFYEMSFVKQLTNSFFLSVTPRTAGFASIDYGSMSYAGLILTIVLMFIGGTSGSTAGGIKTTTLGVLLIQLVSTLKGRDEAEWQERSIPRNIVMKSFVLFFFASLLCLLSALVLSMTEYSPQHSGIEYVLFEVVSAFATVGLTMGLTPHLTLFGKLLIMCLMFIGRVGLYTVMYALLRKELNELGNKFNYPKETVLIG
ncbi:MULTISPECIES: TrkH family potassium uptake protein [Enterococcaceae]|uniref:TrkH family potassium uptake protein n=1 Tax=Enterococcaceae TaxID=81852 RepID=UPI000E54F690|nr:MULTISPECIES: TrkH family potassium uptake protein [Enterococcaceae]MCI0130663.1 TrkH family potassium uptake protein [Vagococcus sp. CY53-2]RGI32369.1 Trk family potassium uptake protein [Melissococcus sp. OM08-11BH]UNM90085.1 TrkH family potassium uptake protein [Vagococcus sp. CY52-2]